jgi:hypothetical protein
MTLDARYWDRDFETRPWAWIESWQAQQVATMLDTLPQRSDIGTSCRVWAAALGCAATG